MVDPRDDIAAYSMSVSLDSQIRGLRQGALNINDMKGMLETADSALGTQFDILNQMRSLALQGASSTLTSQQRSDLNNQLQSLLSEFNRITNETTFGDLHLLDGSSSEVKTLLSGSSTDSLSLNLPNLSASKTFTDEVGTGTFVTSQTSTTASTNWEQGDVNGDGIIDLVRYAAATVVTQLGKGDGKFHAARTFAAAGSIGQLKVLDMNGDNADDLVMTTGGTQIAVYFSNGDGTYQTAITQSASHSFFDVGDIDHDGDMDMVGASSLGFFTHLNNGDGSFAAATTLAHAYSSAAYIKLADVNRDGNLDFISSTYYDDGIDVHYYFSTYLGDGSGGFSLASDKEYGTGVPFSSDWSVNSFEVADLNGDGLLDIAGSFEFYPGFGNETQSIATLLGDGSGTFANAVSQWSATASNSTQIRLAVGDLDGNGYLDIIYNAATNGRRILYNTGGGVFATSSTYAAGTPNNTSSPLIGDFNNDGVLDIGSLDVTSNWMNIYLQKSKTVAAGSNLTVNSVEASQNLIGILDTALTGIQNERAQLSAVHSRLEFAASHNLLQADTLSEAKEEAVGLNIAEEVSELVRLQILQNAQVAVAAQANLNLQVIATLLRDL